MNPVRCKALVIGSGAGGAPAAATLAQRWGDGVVIVEAGPSLSAKDFTQRETELIPKTYVGGGTQATEDGAIGVVQGGLVGGSTVINDGLCFRPPPEMEERWAKVGAPVDMAALNLLADEVEAALSVEQIPREKINRANYLLALGARRQGWSAERLRHNSPGCVQCGFRHLGCAYDAKQSMNMTYVPRALSAGARLHADTAVHHLERVGELWRAQAGEQVFEAEHVVLAAGVVQTPSLLLRSNIAAGQGLAFHLQTLAWGDFEDPVDGFNGIPMSAGVLEFADIYGHKGPGYLIEGVSTQPLAFSVQPPWQGEPMAEALGRYRHLAGAVMLLRSEGQGHIKLGPEGRPAIHHPLSERDAGRIEHFFARAVELWMSAGAKRVLPAHRQAGWITEPRGDLPIELGRLYLYTAHPFGGACRGQVLDAEGRVKGQKNLWVLDASAFPEALGVNPQITIASLSLQGARRLLDEAA